MGKTNNSDFQDILKKIKSMSDTLNRSIDKIPEIFQETNPLKQKRHEKMSRKASEVIKTMMELAKKGDINNLEKLKTRLDNEFRKDKK